MLIVRIGLRTQNGQVPGALFGGSKRAPQNRAPKSKKGPKIGCKRHPQKGPRVSYPMRNITVAAQVSTVGELPSY